MSIQSHLVNLKQKHANLEQQIKIANDNKQADLRIKELKKRKLRLKEQIDKLEV